MLRITGLNMQTWKALRDSKILGKKAKEEEEEDEEEEEEEEEREREGGNNKKWNKKRGEKAATKSVGEKIQLTLRPVAVRIRMTNMMRLDSRTKQSGTLSSAAVNTTVVMIK